MDESTSVASPEHPDPLSGLVVIPVWDKTPPSAASVLGLGRSVSYKLVRDGTIPSIRLGHRIVVPVAALRRLLDGE
jgi:excisionase family DNA binding protein